MNIKELKIELVKQNLSIPKLADLIHMNKTTLYKRFNGEICFSQKEISDISTVLGLSQERIFEIFLQRKLPKGNKPPNPPRKELYPMKNTSRSNNRKCKKVTVKATVDTSDVDIALNKATRLCNLLKEANSLIKELTSSEHSLKIDINR